MAIISITTCIHITWWVCFSFLSIRYILH
jgi:hypothetical protein